MEIWLTVSDVTPHPQHLKSYLHKSLFLVLMFKGSSILFPTFTHSIGEITTSHFNRSIHVVVFPSYPAPIPGLPSQQTVEKIMIHTLGDGPKLVIIIHPLIYQWKRNLVSIYLSRCGDKWVTKNVEIGFSLPADTGSYNASCLLMLQSAGRKEEHGMNQAGTTQWCQVSSSSVN
jgi:hypothetical protein